ncbi:MAG: hypothetical protein ABIP80_01055 [Ferruginibacter sp.]
MDKLLKYLNSLAKYERALFIDACVTSEGYLRKAISNKQQLGAGLCIAIERESGGVVRCEDMIPAGVDWAYIRASQPKRATV